MAKEARISLTLQEAVDKFRAVERAQRAVEARKRELAPCISRLSEEEFAEYARLTDRRT